MPRGKDNAAGPSDHGCGAAAALHFNGEKVRILAETQESGASVCAVARRHGLSPSLLYSWKKAFREQSHTALALSQKESGFVKILTKKEQPEQMAEPEVVRVHLNEEIAIDFPPLMDPGQIAGILRALRH